MKTKCEYINLFQVNENKNMQTYQAWSVPDPVFGVNVYIKRPLALEWQEQAIEYKEQLTNSPVQIHSQWQQ